MLWSQEIQSEASEKLRSMNHLLVISKNVELILTESNLTNSPDGERLNIAQNKKAYLANTSHHFSKTGNKLGGAPSLRACY